MSALRILMAVLPLFLGSVSALCAEEAKGGQGTIFTFWPLFDYRDSPQEGYRNLSLLGPLLKFQQHGADSETAIRPFFYRKTNDVNETVETTYLYPLASSEKTPETERSQILQLFQSGTFHRDEGAKAEKSTMLFPLYISGKSEKYGEYTSVFPLYGDIYERFWRDEYHYILFPLYGRTVNKGTTIRNYLYPFFSSTEGDHESGFKVWPLYGQAAKEGVYRRQFVLWPIYLREKTGLDTDNPVEKMTLFPLYSAVDSPDKVSRSYLWPFFGYTVDRKNKAEEVDYLWPLCWTVRGEKRNVNSFLPFYSEDRNGENLKNWYLWPLYKHEEIRSDIYVQERARILFFLYNDNREMWPRDGKERRRSALWPLFLYTRDPRGISSISLPAPVESIFNNEGIERNWAPLWRIYQQRWNESGDSAVSFLWNLYWHEVRGDDMAYELFPLVAYRAEKKINDLQLLKGLIRYRNNDGEKSLAFFWLPVGPHWGKAGAAPGIESATATRSAR